MANTGLVKVEKKSSKDNSEFSMFAKILRNDIVKSILIMGKWPKNMSIKECDNACKLDENRNKSESSHSNLELFTDPIQE